MLSSWVNRPRSSWTLDWTKGTLQNKWSGLLNGPVWVYKRRSPGGFRLCGRGTGIMPCSGLMMMIHMGLLSRAGPQFNHDEPRLELTRLPTLHWLCLHVTLQLLQNPKESSTFKSNHRAEGRKLRQRWRLIKGCSDLPVCFSTGPYYQPAQWKQMEGGGPYTEWPNKTRGRKTRTAEWDQAAAMLVAWRLKRDSERGLRLNPPWANSRCSVKTSEG